MHIACILLSEIIVPFFSEQESDSTTYYIINPIIGSVSEKQLHDIIQFSSSASSEEEVDGRSDSTSIICNS